MSQCLTLHTLKVYKVTVSQFVCCTTVRDFLTWLLLRSVKALTCFEHRSDRREKQSLNLQEHTYER